MVLRRNWLICCTLFAALLATNADAAAQEEADSSRDLILLSADGPVFVRILLKVDGVGFRQRWREYADKVFASIDADGSQSLDMTEADKIPALIAAGAQITEERTLWSQMDVKPADGKVAAEEFRVFVVGALEGSLAIRPFATTRAQAVAMFPRLDLDRDGQLSADEIAKGYQTLRSDDIDGNDVIGIDELLPPQDPTMPAEVRSTAEAALDLPFIELRDGNITAEQAVEVLLNRYSKKGRGKGEESSLGLTKDQLALDAAAMSRFDGNRDGLLDSDELVGLAKDPQPRVRFLVELRVRTRDRPKVRLLSDDDKLASNVQQTSLSRLSLTLAGVSLSMAVTRPRTTTGDAVNLFRVRFLMADADKNRYIDAQEFGGLAIPATTFETVDKNGDGKVFRDELDAYVDEVNGAADSQLNARISKQGRTLFQMLDDNRDLRLTRREFQEGPERLAELDTNNDGRFAEAEFQHKYHFSFRSGESPLVSSNAPQTAANAQATPTIRDDTSGPFWFQRMDRNRDGDVSQREFLGSPATFKRLDVDGDGLLTGDEAEMADKTE
jgi:Ca2+-binding EF-hand superfamily protein